MPTRVETPNKDVPSLDERVDELAVKSLLGSANQPQLAALLEGVRQHAERDERNDVAKIAAESLVLLSDAANITGASECLSNNIVRMQRALDSEGEMNSANVAAPAPAPPPLGEDPGLIRDFILESREHLAQVEMQMMTLEKAPDESEAINTVFRAFHTVKGVAGFLDLGDIREVAHETESLLDLVRDRKLQVTPDLADVVLGAADFLKVWFTRLETSLASGDAGPAPDKTSLLKRIRRAVSNKPEIDVPQAKTEVQAAPPETNGGDRRKGQSSNWTGPERRSGEGDRRAPGNEAHSVKVDTAKLDFLVDMAGEMVIAQSMVRHHPELAALRSPGLMRSLAQLARITGDLQKTAMSMRMVPVSGLFQKMNRLVRDLARKTGKQAEMEAVGGDTELDRNVVEELTDPLMHMVRNAVDHGLEPSEERIAAGKDPTGRICLRESHQAGYIVIEVIDDGRGLSREKILDKARRTGLVEDGAALSDTEVFSFIFHPGFSTATEVTDVSGRGVGMDVVRKQIQKLRGRVDIESVPGKGTSFFLRLPLTLAMIDGLVIGVGAERYVVPIFSVREMLRPSAEMLFTVEDRREMALVRNNLMPVVRLYERFGVAPRTQEATESLLIVAEAAGKSFCLMVDELIGKQEVVIKSLGESLKDIPGVAGGAILGDGRVGLILDVEGIFRAGCK